MKYHNRPKYSCLFLLASLLLLPLLSSCGEPDELVPRQSNSINHSYKMPDPVPLSVEEVSIVEQIRTEYQESTRS